MPANTPDQQITYPIGTDLANAELAFVDQLTDIETRLVLKYANVADRTARHVSPQEGDLTGLAAENRYDVYDGTGYVSLAARSDHFLARRITDGVVGNGAVNNSTALVSDPSLVGSLDTGATYMWRSVIFYDSSTTADIKFTFTTPTFSSMRWSGVALATTVTTFEGDVKMATQSVSGSATSYGGVGVGTVVACTIEGFIVTTAAGNLQFQFAQNTLDATQTTIRTGSYLRAWRIL